MFKRLFQSIADWWERMRTPYVEQSKEPEKPREKTPEEKFREKFPNETIPEWKEADLYVLKYCSDKTLEAKALIKNMGPFRREDYEGIIFEPEDNTPAMLDPGSSRPSNKYALYLWEHCAWDRKLAESVGKEMSETFLLRKKFQELEELETEMKKAGYETGVKTSRWPSWKARPL
jgi:hypothetical protein